jgi:mycofactocin precursor
VSDETTATSGTETDTETRAETGDEQLVHETLVEEVSIDGMCGVY